MVEESINYSFCIFSPKVNPFRCLQLFIFLLLFFKESGLLSLPNFFLVFDICMSQYILLGKIKRRGLKKDEKIRHFKNAQAPLSCFYSTPKLPKQRGQMSLHIMPGYRIPFSFMLYYTKHLHQYVVKLKFLHPPF